jgi:hypothetical protein
MYHITYGKKIKAKISWRKIEKNFMKIQSIKELRSTFAPKLMKGGVRVAA